MIYLINCILLVIFYVLACLPVSKMFEKAGEEGYKAYIPFYNAYILFKLAWKTSVFWIIIILSIPHSILNVLVQYERYAIFIFIIIAIEVAFIVLGAKFCYNLSKSYGHGVGYAIGLFLLSIIFEYIIGFGESVYVGNTTQNNIDNVN